MAQRKLKSDVGYVPRTCMSTYGKYVSKLQYRLFGVNKNDKNLLHVDNDHSQARLFYLL